MSDGAAIRVRGAREHNLRGVDVDIPRGALTVVTGVSGSGKSSLVFDILHAEGHRRYLETLSPRARRLMQQLPAPAVDEVRGVTPSLALEQRTTVRDPRATVGTLSGLWDLLRLLFANHGTASGPDAPERIGFGLFSFNREPGACPGCGGSGTQEQVAEDLLIADPAKTLRQGALVPTLKSGYIVYSQVTVDVLNQVCQAHGFDVDTPWNELSAAQQRVVLHGSDRIEVPFGKHSLESRMRWEGITAKPRELGHYKGLVPTIAATLQRNRNPNVLRFARTAQCAECDGTRLSPAARSVYVAGQSITDIAQLELPQLREFVMGLGATDADRTLSEAFARRLDVLLRLGSGHLHCARPAASLSGGEAQRVRMASCAISGLSGVTYVFDEPSIGLHPSEEAAVLEVLRSLRDAGNTVVVVEHGELALAAADHVIDLGPGAGSQGGELVWSGPPDHLAAAPETSVTRRVYVGDARGVSGQQRVGSGSFAVRGAAAHNLQNLDVEFRRGALNVVCGVAGAGKSTLVDHTLATALRARLHGAREEPGAHTQLVGVEVFRKVVHVDQAAIGRTPRSNAATYTGLFDVVRARFAEQPLAVERGYTAGTFSTNTKDGGRCPDCEGAGREVVGMHGLPDVEVVCSTCGGRRYRSDVLDVEWQGLSIADILEASVREARRHLRGDAEIDRILARLDELGLGYLPLGQPATTLSGGEAQRIKLATDLARPSSDEALYVLDEPTVGLHRADVSELLVALQGLVEQGHTVLVVEHDLDVLRAADWLVELGPGGGRAGGQLVAQGSPADLEQGATVTGRALRGEFAAVVAPRATPAEPDVVTLRGVRTNNLRGFDVSIPARGLTVITGVSGSGKSSLAFDTLHAAASGRFTEHLSGHARRQLGGLRGGDVRAAEGLRPTVPLEQQRAAAGSSRSTVATLGALHPLLRTIWSRCGETPAGERTSLAAGDFSFQRREGACPQCEGLGVLARCDPARIIAAMERPLFGGALAAHPALRGFADPAGRHRALFDAVAAAKGFDPELPFAELPERARELALHGAGAEQFDAVWTAAKHEGDEGYRWRAEWPGLCAEVEAEFRKRRGTARGARLAELMRDATCRVCDGERLAPESREVRFGGHTPGALCRQAASTLRATLRSLELPEVDRQIASEPLAELDRRLGRMEQLGLGHLQLDRAAPTLSAGELQRTRLARQLAAPLHGVLYVLDEPTVGLHPRDVASLLELLRELVDAGNGVVVVEHDEQLVAAADLVVEMGPGGGREGGELVATAAPHALPANTRSARLLATRQSRVARPCRLPADAPRLVVRGGRAHELRNIDVELRCGGIVAITGVSGSGKTSLLRDVLGATAKAGHPVNCDRIDGLERFDRVIIPDRLGISRAPHSCPATVLDVYDKLRRAFAKTAAAKSLGAKAGAFAYASKGGRCEVCSGLGRVRTADFDFLGDAWQRCSACGGLRFEPWLLAVEWHGKNIADWLEASLDEAIEVLDAATRGKSARAEREMRDVLRLAQSFALGYLPLGQGADTLSGGEAQRLFLAAELAKGAGNSRAVSGSAEQLLFLLDEPGRGLHADDVAELLHGFDRLTAGRDGEPGAGHTLIVVEHDLQIIAAADQVVELGPGGGPLGGTVVANEWLPMDATT